MSVPLRTLPPRRQIIATFTEKFGTEVAMTMAEHLPPAGWAEVATRRDLDVLETRMGARFDQVEARLAAHESRFDAVDARFDAMDAKFEAKFEAKFDAMDVRFGAMETRFDVHTGAIHDRLDGFRREFRAELLGELDRRFAAQTRTMLIAFVSTCVGLGGLIVGAANLLA